VWVAISVFHLFSIGIGPSSSHTLGPMRAARVFALALQTAGFLEKVKSIKVDLYGSLALTGKGHATDIAILLGLEGEVPEDIDPSKIKEKIEKIRNNCKISLLKTHEISFVEEKNLIFHKDKKLPYHPNGMRFTVYDENLKELDSHVYYSVGGGFIVDHLAASRNESLGEAAITPHRLPYPFETPEALLMLGEKHSMSIATIMMENEKSFRSEEEVKLGLLHIWEVMQQCVQSGISQGGILPGGLGVKRRAKQHYEKLMARDQNKKHPAEVMEWVSVWALAVNEENASAGRVVTAPTNGAAGIIPAVLHYYMKYTDAPTEDGVITFLLVAGAIGILYKEGASISAAEMGCMGEVGVACSMAAAGLTAALGGSNKQIENAAEIGMEHNLGLTCDPVKGLVQIPCIERNTMGAVKAINASLLALQGDGTHFVSLGQVIATMRETGHNMKSIYKETSLGGLAVNVPEC